MNKKQKYILMNKLGKTFNWQGIDIEEMDCDTCLKLQEI